MKKKSSNILSIIRGDAVGGITASLVGLPESIAYGCLVVAPLGAKFIPLGVVFGLICQAFLNLGPAPFIGARILNSGPNSLSSLMLASMVTIIMGKVSTPSTILTLLFLVIFFAGIFQVLFGLLRMGDLAKYIPYPVISGLLNGTAILIFASQVKPVLGLSADIKWQDFTNHLDKVEPFTMLMAIITVMVVILGNKWQKKIPSPFLGIIAGAVIFHAIKYFVPELSMGQVVGSIPLKRLEPNYFFNFQSFLFNPKFRDILLDLLPFSFGIAIIVSLRTLISIVSVDNLFMERSNSNRELMGQGFGNILSASFGGIAGAGSVTISIAGYKYGSRTPLSRVFTGLFIIAIIMFLGPVVAMIPKVVLSGLLIVLSLYTFDSWVFSQIPMLFSKEGQFRRLDILLNILLVFGVAIIMLIIGIFEAVGVGIVASIMIFLLHMGKNIVRRQFSGSKMRSNVERPEKEIEILEKQGFRIRLFELEGSLFFGTADKVASIINHLPPSRVEYIILDMRGINQIDSTGIHILQQLKERCRKNKQKLILSSLKKNIVNYNVLCSRDDCYDNIEDALAWAEDKIIDKYQQEKEDKKEIALHDMDAFSQMTKRELDTLKRYMTRANYKKGRIVFKQGDPPDAIYFIVKGRADIFIGMKKDMTRKRLSTLCPGTIFGEMAIIDGRNRSAGVITDTDMTCYKLPSKKLESLDKNYPKIAYKILAGVSRELSKRIRINISMISQLKSR